MTAPKTTTRRKAPAFKPTAHPDIYEATMADAKRAGLFKNSAPAPVAREASGAGAAPAGDGE
ncbi:MAG: hypothetical protein J2P30_01680 [Actinobacteria bacterium]|nr:hypothetical protein [Actinomycetota bacterium]